MPGWPRIEAVDKMALFTFPYIGTSQGSRKQSEKRMSFFLQYHNYWNLGLFPQRNPPFLEQRGYITVSLRFTKLVPRALGNDAFLLLGIGNPRHFYLWERFTVDRIEEVDSVYLLTGPGRQMNPPPRLQGRAFKEFQKSCADFASFREITDLPYCQTLISLSTERRKSRVDATTEAFCTEILPLAMKGNPEWPGDAYYYRGFVRLKLGKNRDASSDLRKAREFGTRYGDVDELYQQALAGRKGQT
jgi:hypothetical protein